MRKEKKKSHPLLNLLTLAATTYSTSVLLHLSTRSIVIVLVVKV